MQTTSLLNDYNRQWRQKYKNGRLNIWRLGEWHRLNTLLE